jgi:hypothetical protein
MKRVEDGCCRLGGTAASVQALQELFVNLVGKGQSSSVAEPMVRDFRAWPIVDNTFALLKHRPAKRLPPLSRQTYCPPVPSVSTLLFTKSCPNFPNSFFVAASRIASWPAIPGSTRDPSKNSTLRRRTGMWYR